MTDSPSVIRRDLIEGAVELELVAQNDGVQATVYDTRGEARRAIHSAVHDGFLESQQKRGTFRNAFMKNLPEGLDGSAAGSEFGRVISGILSQEDAAERALRPPVVNRLLDETAAVEVFGGGDTEIAVTLERDGAEREVRFTAGEWMSNNPQLLREQYYSAFYDRIELNADTWEELVEAWESMKEIKPREKLTTEDAIRSRVLGELQARVEPYDAREKVANGEFTAWYDAENEMGHDEVPDGEPTVWVKTGAVQDALRSKTTKDETYISELAKGFRKAGATHGTTYKRGSTRFYPFVPEAVGVVDPEADVYYTDDDTEVVP